MYPYLPPTKLFIINFSGNTKISNYLIGIPVIIITNNGWRRWMIWHIIGHNRTDLCTLCPFLYLEFKSYLIIFILRIRSFFRIILFLTNLFCWYWFSYYFYYYNPCLDNFISLCWFRVLAWTDAHICIKFYVVHD